MNGIANNTYNNRTQCATSDKRFVYLPCLNGVNLKSGRYFISFALLAVFLYWPSALLVSY